MTLQIEVDPQTEARLTVAAEAKGIALQVLAEELLRGALQSPSDVPSRATSAEFRDFLDALATHTPGPLGFDDRDWSRSILYSEHD